MKKYLVLILTLLLMTAAIPASAQIDTAASYYAEDCQYSLQADGTAVITMFLGEGDELVIPDVLDGHAVTALGDYSYFSCGATKVTIPDSITSVGMNPFLYCTELVSIHVSDAHPSLEIIDGALCSRADGTLISVPGQLVGASYTIPDGVRCIGADALSGSDALTTVHIPDSVVAIGDSAFSACGSLRTFTIPGHVVRIGDNPFSGCDALEEIIVPKAHPTLEVAEGILYDKTEKRLICVVPGAAAVSCVVPEGIEVIGASAFSGCMTLGSITLPGSVRLIDKSAFSYCLALAEVNLSDGLAEIGHSAFSCCMALSTVVLPDSVEMIGKSAFLSCTELKELTLSKGLRQIGEAAFGMCSSLTSLTIPENVTSIGTEAFWRCDALNAVTLPEGLQSIGDSAFGLCPALTSIDLPASVTDLGEWVFYDTPVTVKAVPDSYAAQWCQENRVSWVEPAKAE